MKAKSTSEIEARALDALAGYGTDAFLECFYKHMGKAYLQPYEKGLIELFDSIRGEIPPHLNRVDKARKVYEKDKE